MRILLGLLSLMEDTEEDLMRKEEFRVSIYLQKNISLEVEEGEVLEDVLERAWSMFHRNKITDAEYEELLATADLDFIHVEAVTLYNQVKEAIDNFDPYVLMPGHEDGAPDDEYDPISKRIADALDEEMPVEEIARVIGAEFHYSFDGDFPPERCMRPAKMLYEYFNENK